MSFWLFYFKAVYFWAVRHTIANNYLQFFLLVQCQAISFSSLSIIPIVYNFECVVIVLLFCCCFFFPPKCITSYSSVFKFNYNLITLSLSIVRSFFWVFEINTELTILNNSVIFSHFHTTYECAEYNKLRDRSLRASLATFLHSELSAILLVSLILSAYCSVRSLSYLTYILLKLLRSNSIQNF